MGYIREIRRAKGELYKALKELESWGGEEGMWRDYALRDYDEATMKIRRLMSAHGFGPDYIEAWCDAVDEMARRIYDFSEVDIRRAKHFVHGR